MKMASQESKETLESKEREESWEFLDRGERTVLRGQRVVSDPLARSAHLVWLERRVNLVFLVCLDILEDKESRDLSVSQDSLVPTARKEEGASLERLDLEDREDQLDPEAREVPVAQLESLALRDHQEVMGLPDL